MIYSGGRAMRWLLLGVALNLLGACDWRSQSQPSLADRAVWLNQGQQQAFELRGRWLLVNYWAVWCKPCVKEIPELNELRALEPRLQVIGVNYDRPPLIDLQRQASQLNITFPQLLSDPAQLGLKAPAALPTSYLINPEGQLVKTLLGPQTASSVHGALTEMGF